MCLCSHYQGNCYQKDRNGNVNNYMVSLIVLLTMLLENFLEKHAIRNRVGQQLDFKCGECEDEFNTASGSEI